VASFAQIRLLTLPSLPRPRFDVVLYRHFDRYRQGSIAGSDDSMTFSTAPFHEVAITFVAAGP
jgi:hypothetical protein